MGWPSHLLYGAPTRSHPFRSLASVVRSQFAGGEGCAPIQRKAMATGTVKWFNTQKGYGFIQPDDGSKDVFVHISAVERSGIGSLRDGQKVSYDVVQDRGKPAATNLKGS